jgi:hypothetical protein
MLDAGYSLLVTCYLLLVTGYWMLVARFKQRIDPETSIAIPDVGWAVPTACN